MKVKQISINWAAKEFVIVHELFGMGCRIECLGVNPEQVKKSAKNLVGKKVASSQGFKDMLEAALLEASKK